MDLPCIIETLKTTDNKTFYKTSDISQMVICSNDMEPSDDEPDSPKKKKEKGRYILYCVVGRTLLYTVLCYREDTSIYCTVL